MRQVTNSTFTDGLIMDLNPLNTPNNCLVDCLNGTIITYNGNEYVLQNDMGNVKLDLAEFPAGYLPVGMKEYGGIIYVALVNPETNKCQVGSIPSPDYNQTPQYMNPLNPNAAIEDNQWVTITHENDNIVENIHKGYEFSDKFVKLFEREQMELNPGDKYAILYKITVGDKAPDVESTNYVGNKMYDVLVFAVDSNNKQYEIQEPNMIQYLENKTEISQSDYKYFDQTMSSVLALKVSINRIDFFEAWAYAKNNIITLSMTGSNKIIGQWVPDGLNNDADDQVFRGVKLEYDKLIKLEGKHVTLKTEEYYYFDYSTEPENSAIINKDANGTLTWDYSDLENKSENINFEITPFDDFGYLSDLKRNLLVNLLAQYDESSQDIFMYYYNKTSGKLTLKFNLPTVYFSAPAIELEFYSVTEGFSTMYGLAGVNPSGLNTLIVDVVTDISIDGIIEETTLNKRIGNVLTDRVRKNSNLIANHLYLVRIHAYDVAEEWNESMVWPIDGYNDKVLYYFLIIDEGYNDLYNLKIESDNYINFNTIDLHSYNGVVGVTYELNKGDIVKDDIHLDFESNYAIADKESDLIPKQQYKYNLVYSQDFTYKLTPNISGDSFFTAVSPTVLVNNISSNISISDSQGLSNNKVDIITEKDSYTLQFKNIKSLNFSSDIYDRTIRHLKTFTSLYDRMPKYRADNTIDFKNGDLVKAVGYTCGNYDYPKILSVDYDYDSLDTRRKNVKKSTLRIPSGYYGSTASVMSGTDLNGEWINYLLSIVDGLRSSNGYVTLGSYSLTDTYKDLILSDKNRIYDGLICEFYEIYNIEDKKKQITKYLLKDNKNNNITDYTNGIYLAFRRYDAKDPEFSNDFVFVHFTDYLTTLEILKDLKVASINEVEKWALYFGDLSYDIQSTITTGKDSYYDIITSLAYNSYIKPYNGEHKDSIESIKLYLVDVLGIKEILDINANYFTLGDKSYTETKTYAAPSISITNGIDSDTIKFIQNSYNDLSTMLNSLDSSFTNGKVYSESGKYADQAKRFTGVKNETRGDFNVAYTPQNLVTKCKWADKDDHRTDAPDFDNYALDTNATISLA